MILHAVFSTMLTAFPQLISAQNDGQVLTTALLILLAATILCTIIGIAFPVFFIAAGIFFIATLIVGIIQMNIKSEI